MTDAGARDSGHSSLPDTEKTVKVGHRRLRFRKCACGRTICRWYYDPDKSEWFRYIAPPGQSTGPDRRI